MKALIFNSGIGKRMGELTAHAPKSMVPLYNGETIFERQIRLLQEAGIRDVVITTGPYPEMLKAICSKPCYGNMNFSFPHNEIYDSSNYIYSMYRARDLLGDDFLTLHGDLVFDRELLPSLLKDKRQNLCLVDPLRKQPEKDFKGRIKGGFLREVSVKIFDDDCYAFQPLYKLSRATLAAWLNRVCEFVDANNINVYAENALNEIADSLSIQAKSFHGHFLEEVDNPEDLARVNKAIQAKDLDTQICFSGQPWESVLQRVLDQVNGKKPFFVADPFLKGTVQKAFPNAMVFSNFTPNPKYEEIVEGIRECKSNHCDTVVSIGGGSCIDVAKTIRYGLTSNLDSPLPAFRQPFIRSDVKHISIPTTSGTGSESTRHAAIYLNGVKQSFSHYSLIPDFAILDPSLVLTVPPFIKRATALDAFCQCVESTWSKKATNKSRRYANNGIQLFKSCLEGYLSGDFDATEKMQLVAHYSGKAINISETTAGHAMSYALTTEFGTPHGYAVALSLYALTNKLDFGRLQSGYPLLHSEIKQYLHKMDLPTHLPKPSHEVIMRLASKINPERLANFPFDLTTEMVVDAYEYICSGPASC